MSWPLRYHPARPAEPKTGDCWPTPERLDYPASLSAQYFAQNSGRPPLVVRCPCGTEFCVDNAAGWDVRGEPEALTVSPSIRHMPGWHGFITAGVITDDVDGRVFP